jgi:hypothetical protein
MNTERQRPSWAYETSLACIAMTLVSVFQAYACFGDRWIADDLVPVLISTSKLTVYYWDADRYGMLIPALASFAENPLVNAGVQGWLTALCANLSILSFSYLAGGGGGLLPRSLTAAAAQAVISSDPAHNVLYHTGQSYAPAMLFTGLGLILAGKSALREDRAPPSGACAAASFACFLIGFWVNKAMAILAFAVAAGQILLALASPGGKSPFARAPRVRLLTLGLAAGALAVNAGLSRLLVPASVIPGDYGLLPVSEWLTGIRALLVDAADKYLLTAWRKWVTFAAIALAAATGVIAAARGERARQAAPLLLGALVLLAEAAAYGTNAWVKINAFDSRYLQAGQTFLLACLCAALPLPDAERARRALAACAAALAAALGVAQGGLDPAAFHHRVFSAYGAGVDEARAADCSCLAGNYWQAWPKVFLANASPRPWTDGEMVWGISYRSKAVMAEIEQRLRHNPRICLFDSDPDALALIKELREKPGLEIHVVPIAASGQNK